MEDVFQNIGSKLTLSQRIERTLENAIREKKLPVGSKLPTEREMCESFGVSRTALREALRRLSARGLITIQKGSGMYVSEIRIEDAIKTLNLYYDLKFDRNLIEQIIEVRQMFEPEIARYAARNRSDDHVKELKDNLRQFRECNPDNTQLESDLDNKFHLGVARAASNPIIQMTMEPIYTLLPRMRNFFYANIDGEKAATLASHEELVRAIESREEEEAFRVMKKHLSRTREIFDTHMNVRMNNHQTK
ncbi:MAG: FadR/GntR family transcriptional regulator [Bacteroidales bacterium]